MTWPDRIRGQLAQVVAEDRWRAPKEFDARGPAGALQGHPVVSFASNDYLGLSAHPEVVRAAHDALDRWGAGAGASRLVTGSRPVHSELEHELAEWKGTEAAICFPTGFRRQPRHPVRARRARRAGALRRAQPRQHHRRLPALPFGPGRLPPRRHGRTSSNSSPDRARQHRRRHRARTGRHRRRAHADDRRDRFGVFHGWRRRPARAPPFLMRAPRCAPRPRRGSRRPRPPPPSGNQGWRGGEGRRGPGRRCVCRDARGNGRARRHDVKNPRRTRRFRRRQP